MPHITTRDGVSLYVKDWGRGRPVVLLHGWPLSADTYDDLGMALANAGMRAMANDLADVLEKTGARGAALVGFSMGGGEVVRYLSRFRDHSVTQAVLIGS